MHDQQHRLSLLLLEASGFISFEMKTPRGALAASRASVARGEVGAAAHFAELWSAATCVATASERRRAGARVPTQPNKG